MAANIYGSDKRQFFMIDKSYRSRCFRDANPPIEYHANAYANAWMTSDIFEQWLRAFDGNMRSENRCILLLLDNCTAHEKLTNLTNIKLQYLPANTTSPIQPLDRSIIKNLKAYYRHEQCTQLLSLMDIERSETNKPTMGSLARKISLLEARSMVTDAWIAVKNETIQNCFKKGEFRKPDELHIAIRPLEVVCAPVGIRQSDFDDLVELQAENKCVPKATDQDRVDGIRQAFAVEMADQDTEDDEPITKKELLETIRNLERIAALGWDSEEILKVRDVIRANMAASHK